MTAQGVRDYAVVLEKCIFKIITVRIQKFRYWKILPKFSLSLRVRFINNLAVFLSSSFSAFYAPVRSWVGIGIRENSIVQFLIVNTIFDGDRSCRWHFAKINYCEY